MDDPPQLASDRNRLIFGSHPGMRKIFFRAIDGPQRCVIEDSALEFRPVPRFAVRRKIGIPQLWSYIAEVNRGCKARVTIEAPCRDQAVEIGCRRERFIYHGNDALMCCGRKYKLALGVAFI